MTNEPKLAAPEAPHPVTQEGTQMAPPEVGRLEAWQQRVVEFAEIERDGDPVCRWCAVNRGFHHRHCPLGDFLTAVQRFVDAVKRNGGMSLLPPLPPLPEAPPPVKDDDGRT